MLTAALAAADEVRYVFSRAFLGLRMTDFNSLLSPHSKLYVLATKWINDDGIVVGMAYDASTGKTSAFIAVPRDATKSSPQPAWQAVLPTAARNRAKLGPFERFR